MERIENRTFDELALGDSASLVRTLTYKDVEVFAIMSGDINPAHVDADFAKSDMFHRIVAHGMWGGALISTVLGTQLPGPGTIYLDQSLHFRRPVGLGDTITVTVKVARKIDETHRVTFDCCATNQHGEQVITGTAEVIAPTEKISRPRVHLPEIELRQKGRRYELLIEATCGLDPIRTAIVHPVDTPSLLGAVDAARAKLIVPVFVGPEAKIRAAAAQAELDLSPYEIVSTEHSAAAAARAVAMARTGKVEALMKGALHTDELMRAVIDGDHGLRTGRRISHVYAIDAPDYPRPMFITDAAINIYPTLEDKRDIVQNAIDLTHALGIAQPRVAILSAVETVTGKIRSTLDAAALCKMADRGQITGGILDGPLAFDNAVSAEAAKTKGIVSPVAGCTDIFIVPDLEAGNMLAKQLEYLAEAQVAGIVLGARVPIILTSRSDKTIARLSSCAIALLLARHKAGVKTKTKWAVNP
jgi:phosphotransacetylase/acyl dehydratase